MSWISDLAGRAENILNKIDQNAATVLQQPSRSESMPRIEQKWSQNGISSNDGQTFSDGLRRNLSANSLAKSLSPKRMQKSELNGPNFHKMDEKLINNNPSSNFSSRHSSFSSRTDGSVLPTTTSYSEQQQEMVGSLNSSKFDSGIDFSLERELAGLKISLAEITSERNDLRHEVYDLQTQLSQTSDKRINSLNILLRDRHDEKEKLSQELDLFREANIEYVKAMSDLETNLAVAQKTILELTEKLEIQIKETEQATDDLVKYRKKAQTTLQMKERIIEELKVNRNRPGTAVSGETKNEKILNFEIQGLKQENSHLKDELEMLNGQLEQSREMVQKLERSADDRFSDSAKAFQKLQDDFKAEQSRSLQLESEVRIINQEIHAVREEMQRQRQSYTARLHEKDNELQKLRTRTDGSSPITEGGGSGLEERLHSLTQALVQKQTAIETLTADRNALKLQLEKIDDQLQHVMLQQRQTRSQIIHVNDTDDDRIAEKTQLPRLMRENPFDNNVARRVKRAYTSLDSAGIRVGVLLRRYPLIRIMVVLYVAFLHIWVMFVLLSSTPN